MTLPPKTSTGSIASSLPMRTSKCRFDLGRPDMWGFCNGISVVEEKERTRWTARERLICAP